MQRKTLTFGGTGDVASGALTGEWSGREAATANSAMRMALARRGPLIHGPAGQTFNQTQLTEAVAQWIGRNGQARRLMA